MAHAEYAPANLTLDAGLAHLGYSYSLRDSAGQRVTLDDSGLVLALAVYAERKGKLRVAVGIKCSALRKRLEDCGEIWRHNQIYHLGPLPSRCAVAGDDIKNK